MNPVLVILNSFCIPVRKSHVPVTTALNVRSGHTASQNIYIPTACCSVCIVNLPCLREALSCPKNSGCLQNSTSATPCTECMSSLVPERVTDFSASSFLLSLSLFVYLFFPFPCLISFHFLSFFLYVFIFIHSCDC